MLTIYNHSSLSSKFNDYLIDQKLSRISIYNYQSDLKSFYLWLHKETSCKSFNLSATTIKLYINTLLTIPNELIVKRRLSSFRKFILFLKVTNILSPVQANDLDLCLRSVSNELRTRRLKAELMKELNSSAQATTIDELFNVLT